MKRATATEISEIRDNNRPSEVKILDPSPRTLIFCCYNLAVIAMRPFIYAFVGLLLGGLVLIKPALADNRVALVIGNSAYRKIASLPNTLNDATDVAAALQRLGFSSRTVLDGTFDDMRRAILQFGRDARGAEMAVIYYAGHGMEVGGENWLIPIDAELRSDLDVESESVSLKSAMSQVAGARSLSLVILDSCRDNPFATQMQRGSRSRSVDRGLARIEPADNVLVAYAAKDGTVAADGRGRNSPFTTALLNNLEKVGLEIRFLLASVRDDVLSATGRQQQPFVYGSLPRDPIYLKPPTPMPGPTATNAPLQPLSEIERAWAAVQASPSIAALEIFIRRYNDNFYADLARVRIEELKSAKTTTVSPLVGPSMMSNPTASLQPRPDDGSNNATSPKPNLSNAPPEPAPSKQTVVPNAPQSIDTAKPVVASRQSPADIFRAALSSVTDDFAPAMPDQRRLDHVRLYHADTSHKALAVHPPADSWRSSDWPSEAAAEQNTLEACQMRYGGPCILVAINDKVQDRSTSGYGRSRPMPRVAYEGVFDAQQIPFLREATRLRQDVANYKKSSGPKAIAVHPWGRIFIATGTASQRDAEIAVLADCNNDQSRDGKDGPCWLYAIDDQVVLPKRLKEPLSAPAAGSANDPMFSHENFVSNVVSVLEKAALPTAKDIATKFSKLGKHRSLAVAPKAKGPWWTGDWPARETAEEKLLEKCQQFYNEPCAIIATDNSIVSTSSERTWTTQDAPRVRYSGMFKPERIPALREQDFRRPEIAGYAALLGAKAAAFHATGIFTVGSGLANQQATEARALYECNTNPLRNLSGGPCYLYAVGNQVVLPMRLTEPMTPATPNVR